MKITLLRHTDVDEKYHRCYNGHIDIELSELGHKQAKEMAKFLDMQEFDGVFCSDLQRAKQTLQYSKYYDDAVFTQKLREKSWGKHEGLCFDEIIAQGEIKYLEFIQWVVALDGEPYEEYVKRVREFFLEYLPSLDKENVLVVTHAGVIRVLISLVKQIPLEEAFCINVPYSSYILYDSSTKEFSEVKYNDIAKN